MEVGATIEERYEQAKAWYDAHKAELETPENIGKIVSVDVATGNWAFDTERKFEATDSLRARNPNAQIFGFRVGYDAVYTIGGTLRRTVAA